MKPFLLFRGPVESVSGYGAHSRDLLWSLREMDKYDIKIDSCAWGITPLTALNEDNEFHVWIMENIVDRVPATPDIYFQVTVPNEFRPVGRYNIGVTAGVETTVTPKEWIDGCNKMDLILVSSKFSQDVFMQTVYNETQNQTGRLLKQHRIETPIHVLFEGVDTNIYHKSESDFNLDIPEDFAFLFVGHWLKGDVGHDRKNVGMMIRCFSEAFKDVENPPALILKTSASTYSVIQREMLYKKIKNLNKHLRNTPPIYLLFGELSDVEMNSLYNHSKIKSMISITRGEGFGRPLLEFSLTGKPVIASNWSGHKDFLPMDKAIMIGGSLDEVDSSSIDEYFIKGSKWFTANYGEFTEVLKLVHNQYETFTDSSEELRIINERDFSLESMKKKLESIMDLHHTIKPKEVKIKLPELTKIK